MNPSNISNGAPLPDVRVGSPSSAERASKRLRRSPCNDTPTSAHDTTSPNDQLTLPAEVWADVMNFLPFEDILTCGAVSRSLLHETMPLLTLLRIDTAAQMHLGVASRFRDVTDIHINSLLKEQVFDEGTVVEMRDIDVDLETRIKCIPFVSRFLPTLERVHFGGKNEHGKVIKGFAPADGYFWEGEEIYPNEGPWAGMAAFIDMLSGAFSIGAFPNHLKISGLSCPNNGNRLVNGATCTTCQRACKSFPLESVVAFESKGSSASNACSGRPYGLDVCLPVAEVESIIENRPGGRELLLSDSRLLRLLSSGRRHVLSSDDDNIQALIIVKYTQAELAEIKRVIQYAELDVKKLSPQKVHDAISKSFTGGTALPKKYHCHLSEKSLTALKDEIGLSIDKSRLCVMSSDIRPYLKAIVQILVHYYDEECPFIYPHEDILNDCFKLLRRLVEFEDDVTMEGIDDAIPCLAIALDCVSNKEIQMEAAGALGVIFAKGTEGQRKDIIDAEVIPKFTRLLNSSEDSITKIALLGLVDILVGEKKDHVEAMVNAGGIPKLVEMLHSSEDARVKGSQSLLVIAADDHIQKIIDAKVHDSLFRIIFSDDQVESLPECSSLLRKIFEVEKPPIQQAIDANLVSRLVQILHASADESVETNLAFVCTSLASHANEDNIEALMRDTGLLPLLVSLQDSSIDTISVQAATCLDHVANIRTSFDAECEEPLSWGEYRVLDLVDSDNDSAVSFEEAMEVSNEQVALEEQQAAAANASIYVYQPDSLAFEKDDTETPSLLGIPQSLLQTILTYTTRTQAELNVLATVCKTFGTTVDIDNDGGIHRCHPLKYHPSITKVHGYKVGKSAQALGLFEIRMAQSWRNTDNEIMEVMCERYLVDGVAHFYADELHKLADDILTRMNQFGAVVSFRLRGDTVDHLFELLQDYMVRRLQDALLLAVHSGRTEVQKQDFTLLPSRENQTKCNVAENYHGVEGLSFLCSCGLTSSSNTVWRWPANNCRDLLPPNAGRTIIRRLAYRAGIVRLNGAAFEIAEAELLHTLGVLLVEAYESSVKMSKSARFLGPKQALPYNKMGIVPGSIDMFHVPPPPLNQPLNDEKTDQEVEIASVHTIVPGQIIAAAQRRNIEPHNVYADWTSSRNSPEDEEVIERSYYYKDHDYEEGDHCFPNDCECESDGESESESESDSDDDDCSENKGNSGEDLNDSSTGNNELPADNGVANDNDAHSANHHEAAPAVAAVNADAANVPQPAPARNELDALRNHPRFQELRRSFQNGFASGQTLLREIIQQHPGLGDAIDSNQALFYDLMSQ